MRGVETAQTIKKGQLDCPEGQLHPPQTSSIPWAPERLTLPTFGRAESLIATEPSEAPNCHPRKYAEPLALQTAAPLR